MNGTGFNFRLIRMGLCGLLTVAGGTILLPSLAQALVINNDLIGHDYSGLPNPGGGGPNGTATNGTSTTINSAIFTVAPDNTGTGTGNFDPFIRTHGQPKDYETGFNTDGDWDTDLYDMIPDSNWTHSLTLGDLTVDDSGDYVKLVLDLGEPSGGDKAIISLRGLQLWVNTTTGSDIDYTDGLGTKVWDIDGLTDTTLNLDYDILGGGNGKYDLIALFPITLFTGYAATDFFYLYNDFGLRLDLGDTYPQTYPSEGTFEEWAAVGEGGFDPPDDEDPPEVPVPAPLGMIILGLVLLGASRKIQVG